MKVKMEYIILILIIIALSVFLFLRNKNKTHYNLPEIAKINEKDISKIVLHKTGTDIELLKENDKWYINKEKFPADKEKLEAMVKDITAFNLTALVSESKNYGMYDLDKDKKIDFEIFSGNKVLLKIDIGKTASSYRHTFVKLDNDTNVYQANGNLRNTFDKKISDVRDKVVMNFDENITEIILNNSKKEMKISKKVSSDTTQQKNTGMPAQPEWITDKKEKVKGNEIDTLINTLKHLVCDDFVTEKTKNEFNKSIYKIDLKGNKSYSISIAEKKDDKYIAVSSENNYPFIIPEWRAKNLMKELDSIIDKETKKNK
ncbi:DUF4340 domain-containing protein [Candidatus Desantisbacteria bacterium]|nr:DUF4340 domain-containing protein [Candidatus Desantisbacteria bacterium]